ncbi:HNH endonuclease signature motif containing protein [Nocardioides halotolerans]|uniref:HNH endonuclease signature motif containing protein n=1 Tax=Nocardioides halotolerans TaxID=433660 RepID=UPI0003F7D683|nr:HNH endonuclease signature motif containing protein [Nocardioides halotolerans]
MTSISTPPQHTIGDDPAAVLAYARRRKQDEEDAARDVMKAAAQWAAMHSLDSLVGPVDEWHESMLPLGGQGCPEVREFAVTEFAAAMGRTTESGRRYLSHAVEGFYRLKGCWQRLEAGQLPAWKLGHIADRTQCLSPEAAAFVDAMVAPFAHKIGPAQLDRLIQEAMARFDPDALEAERLAAAEAGHFDIYLDQVGVDGRVRVDGDVDLADALDLEAAVAGDAHQQLLLGSTDSLDVRRARAVGNLARNQATLELVEAEHGDQAPAIRRREREMVLHVHLAEAALLGAGGLARVQETRGPITAEQVREWCAQPDVKVTVQPVLDLAEHLHVTAYEASARLKLQIQLRDLICAFPYCFRPAENCDCEHRVPHDPERDDGGPTCSCNLTPACRGHHRAKTTGGWSYVTVEPGVHLWRSPLGYEFLKDSTGTIDVTPTDERRRLAREFRNHVGDTGAADPEP